MEKPLMLLIVLLVVELASEASATGRCPLGSVCVNERHIENGKRISFHTKQCRLANHEKGVCWDGTCKTTTKTPGICAALDECDVSEDQMASMKKSGWCYKENNKKYYCCPTEHKRKSKSKSEHKGNTTPRIDNGFPSCQTPTNYQGQCIPLALCEDLHDKFMNQGNKATVRNSKCPPIAKNSTTVCCPNPQNPDGLIRHAKAEKVDLDKCGKIHMADKILDGTEAGLGQFPWMANIMYYKNWYNSELVTRCSGSLIHPKYVLTAAHCKNYKFQPVSVRLGEHNLRTDIDCVDGHCAGKIAEIRIEKWIPHEKYSSYPREADIALVKLRNTATINPEQIYPICLPLTEQWLMTKPSQLTVSGWGQTGNGQVSNVLMHAELQLVDSDPICRAEHVICVRGAKMEGHCKGDSGGPLQKIMPWGSKKYRMVLYGVVSGGAIDCSKADKAPGVSMLVGYYLRWILDNMEI